MIRACSSSGNVSLKSNNINTNKLITTNYHDLQKINDLAGYEIQLFLHNMDHIMEFP